MLLHKQISADNRKALSRLTKLLAGLRLRLLSECIHQGKMAIGRQCEGFALCENFANKVLHNFLIVRQIYGQVWPGAWQLHSKAMAINIAMLPCSVNHCPDYMWTLFQSNAAPPLPCAGLPNGLPVIHKPLEPNAQV
jgi:hypothetical protein